MSTNNTKAFETYESEVRSYCRNFPTVFVKAKGSIQTDENGKEYIDFFCGSGALNVALNLLLVVVIPLDVAGVAIATAVSQLRSAVLVTVRLCTFRGPCRLELRKIRLYPDRTGQMLRLGFSAGLQGVLSSASNVMIQSAIHSIGSAVLAGSSAASGIENFIHTALNTFYQSAITFTGQSMDEIAAEFEGKGYGDFKMAVAEVTADALAPVQAEYGKILADKAYVDEVLKSGAERASPLANRPVHTVHRQVGLLTPETSAATASYSAKCH